MNKLARIIIALVAVAVVAGGAVLLFGNNKSDTGQPAGNGTELADGEIAATITYTNSGFSPASVTVPAGSTVRVVNESDEAIAPSSDSHPEHTDNPEINFGDIPAGSSGTIVVSEKGTWGYHNHFKDDHKGTIVVE